ncbi:MAG TPA: gamma-glutamyl-gamma-aminobutyrate hydrolase family protein [Geobacterales bacterium]|nr:gamma-glutamyl-gamma-aminobutyrate hydrolase family protein [Geobacterales bacterium]
MNKRVAILGPSGQYNHLILRRVKELGFYAELFELNEKNVLKINGFDVVIIGGGPARLDDSSQEVRAIKKLVFDREMPVLGICLGFQAIALAFRGKLTTDQPSFGPQKIIVKEKDVIFEGLPDIFSVWESHNDTVSFLPNEFKILAVAEKGYIEAARHIKRPIFGVLFHPEVEHTQFGSKILHNFILLS